MILVMTEAETAALLGKYSRAEISAVQLRRALGGVTYGDVLIQLAAHDLPLPRTPQAAGRRPQAGSKERIARARAMLFPPLQK
jgi:hypothetical protein